MFLSDMPGAERERLVDQVLPVFEPTECVAGPPLNQRRVALITTAGLHRRNDKLFTPSVGEYRVIPNDADMNDLIMSHVSTNFDRTGFQLDLNTMFPIERLSELQQSGAIGSIAKYHYSFMGATPPGTLEAVAKDVADLLKQDKVDAVVFCPV